MNDGRPVTEELVRSITAEETSMIRQEFESTDSQDLLDQATELFLEVALTEEFIDFLTLPAYDVLQEPKEKNES